MMQRQSDDPDAKARVAFREKLGALVRSGKITRAEAGELWKAAFGDATVTDRPDRDRPRETDRPRRADRKKDTDGK